MRLKQCECNNLISVHEATTLIILSLIYPNKYNNKPTLRGLNETHLMNINQMKIDYTKHLTFSSVESALFKVNSQLIETVHICLLFSNLNLFLVFAKSHRRSPR